jgi:hypothetical protein
MGVPDQRAENEPIETGENGKVNRELMVDLTIPSNLKRLRAA